MNDIKVAVSIGGQYKYTDEEINEIKEYMKDYPEADVFERFWAYIRIQTIILNRNRVTQ